MERKVNWSRLILAFLIATFLFAHGIFLGYIARGYVSQSSIDLEQSIRNEVSDLETISLLDDTFPCSSGALDVTSQKLYYLGELITVLEGEKGKFDPSVLELKKLYTVLEVRHFLLIKERADKCGKDYDTILFFYSNSVSCEQIVDRTSFVLTYLRNKYDTVNVYSIDVDLDSDLVDVLKSQYDVQGCSTVVVNLEKISSVVEESNQVEILLN